MKLLLDQVTQFSNDIGMKFGESKCSFMEVERGKVITSTEPIIINNVTIKPMKVGDSYKYLGQDENLGYNGPVNKERVCNEYYKRVKKIWKSELSAYNKHIAHNAFAIPVLTPTFGLLNWTKDEIEHIDIQTRKILCMTGNFHRNSDIDRLYLQRKNGGRGLKCIRTSYEARIIAAKIHLQRQSIKNKYLACVLKHEEKKLIRVGRELLESMNIEEVENSEPKLLSRTYVRELLKQKAEAFKNKPLHGYFRKKVIENEEVDQKLTEQWTNNKYISSHFEAYACAIHEQEIGTKDLINRRERKNNQQPSTDNKCRLCKYQVEDVIHVISSCSKMSSRYYLPIRHDVVAKYVYEAMRKKKNPECKIEYKGDEFIDEENGIEYWWNVAIKTAVKVRHNRPDLVVWNNETKNCFIIEFSCPADVNVTRKAAEKLENYGPLIRTLQLTYPEFKFSFIPVIIGALGTVPKNLLENIKQLNFNEKEAKNIIKAIQQRAIIGSVKICKTFLNFKP